MHPNTKPPIGKLSEDLYSSLGAKSPPSMIAVVEMILSVNSRLTSAVSTTGNIADHLLGPSLRNGIDPSVAQPEGQINVAISYLEYSFALLNELEAEIAKLNTL